MTENNTLAPVQFLPADLAKELDCTENEVRIAAKKHSLNAPYTAPEADVIRMELSPPEPPQNPEQSNAITPPQNPMPMAAAPVEGELSPALTVFCDALEDEITERLTQEMQSRMPSIKASVIDAVLPTKR